MDMIGNGKARTGGLELELIQLPSQKKIGQVRIPGRPRPPCFSLSAVRWESSTSKLPAVVSDKKDALKKSFHFFHLSMRRCQAREPDTGWSRSEWSVAASRQAKLRRFCLLSLCCLCFLSIKAAKCCWLTKTGENSTTG